jgi:protein-tyrosine phosphatase
MLKRVIQWTALITAALSGAAFYRWWSIQRYRTRPPLPLSLLQQPQEDILMLRTTPDSITISWNRESNTTKIALRHVHAGQLSEALHYIASGAQSITIEGLQADNRYMAEVTFEDGNTIKVAERHVPLKSVPNFRDIGGYRTQDGKHVRWNRVYRASRFSNLSTEDAQTLTNMGIHLVCDLRTKGEVVAEPDKLPDGIQHLHLPAESSANRWLELGRMMFDAEYLPNLLLNAYRTVMIDQNPQIFAEIFRRLADEQNYPMVIHCAAGKDRAGIITAMILSFLGVPDEVIIADYTLSNHHYEFFRTTTQKVMLQLQMFGVSERDFDYLLIADGRLMQQALEHVHEHYGTVENYLITAAGVDRATLEQVKRNLLE